MSTQEKPEKKKIGRPKGSKTSEKPNPHILRPSKHPAITDDELRPDELEDLMVGDGDPAFALINAAKQCGLDMKVTMRMLQRVKAQFQPVLGELKKVKTSEISALLDDRAHRALEYMDDYALAKSSAKDLAIIAGIMLEKRALLRGEPTQILSIEDRHNMNELLPKLLQEASKRGMFMDVIDGVVDVTPGDYERESRPRSRLSPQMNINKAKQRKKDDMGDPT